MPQIGGSPGGGGGGGNQQNMMQMILGLAQMKQQQQEHQDAMDLANRQARIQGFATLANIARQTADPTQLADLARVGANAGLGDESEVMNTLAKIMPSQEALRNYGTIQSINTANGLGSLYPNTSAATQNLNSETATRNLTDMNNGQMAGSGATADMWSRFSQNAPPATKDFLSSVFATRGLTGMSQGELAQDQATANLPADQQTAAAQIRGGLRLSAPQEASNAATWAGIRSEDRYHTGELALQQTAQLLGKAANKAAGGLTPQDIPKFMETKTTLMNYLQGNRVNMSQNDVARYLSAIQAIDQQLNQLGVATEPASALTPDQVFQPGFGAMLKNGITQQVSKVRP